MNIITVYEINQLRSSRHILAKKKKKIVEKIVVKSADVKNVQKHFSFPKTCWSVEMRDFLDFFLENKRAISQVFDLNCYDGNASHLFVRLKTVCYDYHYSYTIRRGKNS